MPSRRHGEEIGEFVIDDLRFGRASGDRPIRGSRNRAPGMRRRRAGSPSGRVGPRRHPVRLQVSRVDVNIGDDGVAGEPPMRCRFSPIGSPQFRTVQRGSFSGTLKCPVEDPSSFGAGPVDACGGSVTKRGPAGVGGVCQPFRAALDAAQHLSFHQKPGQVDCGGEGEKQRFVTEANADAADQPRC